MLTGPLYVGPGGIAHTARQGKSRDIDENTTLTIVMGLFKSKSLWLDGGMCAILRPYIEKWNFHDFQLFRCTPWSENFHSKFE